MAGFDARKFERDLKRAAEKAANDGMRKIGRICSANRTLCSGAVEASPSTRFGPLSVLHCAELISHGARNNCSPGRRPSARERTSAWT